MKIIQVQKGSLCNDERTFKYLSGLVNSLVVFVVLQGSDFMTTLQELWYGNIRPNEDKVFSDEEKKLIELMAINPRKRFNIPFSNSDYTVWNLEEKVIIEPEDFLSKGKSTPFSGAEVYGKCYLTVCNGKEVYKKQ